MFRLMLSHHPRLTWLGESEFLVDYVPHPGVWPDVGEYWRKLNTDPRLRRDVEELALGFDPRREYPELVDHFLGDIQRRNDSLLIGATVHRHFDRLVSLWPNARYLHIVRDGRDVARSRIGMGWAGNVWTASFVWARLEKQWDRVKRTLTPDQVMDVHYEALVAEPEATLRQVCDFLGVAYDNAMLRYPESTTYSPPNPQLAFQWRRKLTSTEIRLAEAVQGEVLQTRGYELSALDPLAVGPIRAALLKVQCRAYRSKFRIGRLGPRLYLEDVLSRRLGLKTWQEEVAKRVDQIRLKHLK
jgi:Sulfotransferase family